MPTNAKMPDRDRLAGRYGFIPSPAVGAVLMSASTVVVAINAQAVSVRLDIPARQCEQGRTLKAASMLRSGQPERSLSRQERSVDRSR